MKTTAKLVTVEGGKCSTILSIAIANFDYGFLVQNHRTLSLRPNALEIRAYAG
jgi:hypothetical protein